VRDNGVGGATAPKTDGVGGHGLVGMRERARMFGGTLAAGRVDDGFEVHAHLPATGAPA